MSQTLPIIANAVAILVLVFGAYFPRYRRADMVLAYLVLNTGVLAITLALTRNTELVAGLGLGLFGMLSIIRLRSSELGQAEVAYYFASLALGLLAGIHLKPSWLNIVLPAAIVGIIVVVDHPRLLGSYERMMVTLDHAIADPAALRAELGRRLGGDVVRADVQKVDYINDSTVVDVRLRRRKSK
jgi:Domain of unknown function (DUF4956)